MDLRWNGLGASEGRLVICAADLRSLPSRIFADPPENLLINGKTEGLSIGNEDDLTRAHACVGYPTLVFSRPRLTHGIHARQPRWFHPSYKFPSSGDSNQFVNDRPPSITIAAPVT